MMNGSGFDIEPNIDSVWVSDCFRHHQCLGQLNLPGDQYSELYVESA